MQQRGEQREEEGREEQRAAAAQPKGTWVVHPLFPNLSILWAALLAAAIAGAAPTHRRYEVHLGATRHDLTFDPSDPATFEATARSFLAGIGVTGEGDVQHVTNELHYIARQQTPLSARTRPLCLNRTVFADVMLIVMYNTPNLASMPLLRSLYGDAFPRMQFVVLARDAAEAAAASAIPGILVCTLPPESRVPPSYGPAGVFYDCFARVALSLASPDLRGFLLIHDDVVLNFWNLRHLDQSRVWFPITYAWHSVEGPVAQRWWWKEEEVGVSAAARAVGEMDAAARADLAAATGAGSGPPRVIGGYSDVAYLPSRLLAPFARLSAAFATQGVWVEIAFPTLLAAVSAGDPGPDSPLPGAPGDDLWRFHSRISPLQGSTLWLSDRTPELTWNTYYSPTVDYVHPVKLSEPAHVSALRDKVFPEAIAWTQC